MTDSQLPAAIQNFIEATNRGDCEALVADAGLQRRATPWSQALGVPSLSLTLSDCVGARAAGQDELMDRHDAPETVRG